MTDTLEAPTGPPWWLLEASREEFAEYYDALPSDDHRALILEWIRAQSDWRRTPGTLAMRLDPTTVQTKALAIIDAAIVETIDAPAPLTGGIRGLIISMPPQEGKSERVTRRGAEWILERNPDARIAMVSYDQDNVRRTSTMVRSDIEVFDGSEGNIDLGLRLRKGQQAADRWNLEAPRRGGVIAKGLSGGLTGRPVDAMLIDDPVRDYKMADSTLMSEEAWVWWLSVGRTRLAPGAPVILVLTRWSDLDLAGRLITEQKVNEESGALYYDRWKVINIPAQADHHPENGEVDPLGREPGEWMESARGRTREQWEATKTTTLAHGGTRVWGALYQGRPTPKEGGEIKRSWFRYEAIMPSRYQEYLGSWDMKLKEKRTGDYVAGGMWARVGSHYYLLEVWRGQWSFPVTVNAIALSAIRYPGCGRFLIENTGNGPEVMAELRKAVEDYELDEDTIGELKMTPEEVVLVNLLRRRGLSGLVPENPKGSKTARLRAVSGEMESGHVHLPLNAAWAPAYVDEMAGFGVGGSHDDQVDMTSQALRRLSKRTDDEDDGPLQVPEGRIPKTDPGARSPRAGAIPGATRQAQILRQQLAGRKRETGRQ